MTEELQQLLDRIRTEGVEKAQDEAQAIIKQARARGPRRTRRQVPEAEAATLRRETAERDAAAFASGAPRRASARRRAMCCLQVEQDLVKTPREPAAPRRRCRSCIRRGQAMQQLDLPTTVAAAYLKGGAKRGRGGASAAAAAGQAAGLAGKTAAGRCRDGKKGVTVTPSPAFPDGFVLRLEGRPCRRRVSPPRPSPPRWPACCGRNSSSCSRPAG
jgi:hypothetical protein